MLAVKIKIKDTLTLATAKKNSCRWRERNILIRSHGILFLLFAIAAISYVLYLRRSEKKIAEIFEERAAAQGGVEE